MCLVCKLAANASTMVPKGPDRHVLSLTFSNRKLDDDKMIILLIYRTLEIGWFKSSQLIVLQFCDSAHVDVGSFVSFLGIVYKVTACVFEPYVSPSLAEAIEIGLNTFFVSDPMSADVASRKAGRKNCAPVQQAAGLL
jgi:hypothetical protein